MDIRHITVDFKVKSFQEKTQKDDHKVPVFEFKGYAAVFNNVDLQGDIIVKGAFEKSLSKKSPADIMVFYQHDVHSMPIGILKSIHEDEKGLFVDVQLPLKNTRSRDVAALIEVGGLRKFSIGFFVLDTEEKDGITLLKELDVFDVSVVNFPANPEAEVTEFIPMSKSLKTKSVPQIVNFPLAEQDHPWASNEADARLRAFLDIEEPNSAYRNAHMWFDADAPENFTSYKLLFVDIVDGKKRAIPRAIFAIRAAIAGARGGLDVPERDMPALKRYVNHYYDRMGLEKPFESTTASNDDKKASEKSDIITIKNLKGFKHSDLIKKLRKNGSISKSAAEKLIKSYKFGLKNKNNNDVMLEKIANLVEETQNINVVLSSVMKTNK